MIDSARWPRIRWLLALLALAALFLVASSACGGDDDDDDGGDNATTATGSGDGGGNDGGQDIESRTGEYEKFKGYVKYEARDFSADDALKAMAIYQEGDNSRVDIDSSVGLVTIIDTADASYVCSENQCLKYAAGNTGGVGDALTAFLDPRAIENEFRGADYDVSQEKIAGLDSTCYTAQGNEVCFAEGGLLLRTKSDNGTLEAVEADTDIPDGAFEPPFDVVDLGGFGQ